MPAFLILAAAVATATPAVTPLTYSPPAKSVDAPAVANGSPAMKQDTLGKADDMICKRIVSTGTRFATKDCRTRGEWNQLTADSHQATLDMTSRQNGFSN
jgi:hypothetical protein